ncbi:MAG TPA: PRC-barrel domain-containing protein [Planctomycetaceae bacterium]|nr:PRC-barrel domain-containing protein [Planctomycetaceae bacterium]
MLRLSGMFAGLLLSAFGGLLSAASVDETTPPQSSETAPEKPTVTFKEPPRTRLSVTSSRTHQTRTKIDPAGLHRLSSAMIGAEVLTQERSSVGRVRDLVIGPNGAVEFVVIENDERTHVIPYDVATLKAGEENLTLPLTNEQFRNVPTFAGTSSSLKSAEYRQRLHAAYKEAESVWGVPQAALEQSVARSPIPHPQPSLDGPADAAAAVSRSRFSSQPAQQYGAPILFGASAPAGGRTAGAANVAPRSTTTRSAQATESLAPTAPIGPLFPQAGAFRSPAPRFTGGGNTVNSAGPRTTTPNTASAAGRQIPASTPGNRTAPTSSAGNGKTTSPSGTKYPARAP